jgi:hypothetical protein
MADRLKINSDSEMQEMDMRICMRSISSLAI